MIINDKENILTLTANIVSAYVSHNHVSIDEISNLVKDTYSALNGLQNQNANTEDLKPAVDIHKSITDDYIICLEDGEKLKMLKRHLQSVYGLTPEEYRRKWDLPPDYPMVAPNYAKKRSNLAKQIGLGTKSNRG
ncbi:MAG: MucR family transcriptional regulator [Alphaproteobacteria bacterium]